MNENLRLSDKGLNVLMSLEPYMAFPYFDFKGYSIGHGHLIKANEKHLMDGINESLAKQILISDVVDAEDVVKKNISIKLKQNEFDACVIMAFNVPVAFTTGTVDNLINSNADIDAIGRKWKQYIYVRSNGIMRKSKGLIWRRSVEFNIFKNNDYGN